MSDLIPVPRSGGSVCLRCKESPVTEHSDYCPTCLPAPSKPLPVPRSQATAGEHAVLRYYVDTEFMEDGRTIELLSIGIVCEDGREFYAEDADANWSHASPWVQANVLGYLDPERFAVSRRDLAAMLVRFVAEGAGPPQFWGYYADYDWVVLCQVFGTMLDLPDGWPMFCMDLKQLAVEQGNPKLPDQSSTEHHALADARWNLEVHDFLRRIRGQAEWDRRHDWTPEPTTAAPRVDGNET